LPGQHRERRPWLSTRPERSTVTALHLRLDVSPLTPGLVPQRGQQAGASQDRHRLDDRNRHELSPTTIAPPANPVGGAVTVEALGPSAPVSLEIPAIEVRSSLLRLGLNPDGTVEVPPLTLPRRRAVRELADAGRAGTRR
jgi:hypothetical protein